MPKPDVIVSQQVHLDRAAGLEAAAPPREDVEVRLDGDRRVRLAAGNEKSAAYARILAGLEELKRPVYLELEPGTETVSMLRIPDLGRARNVQNTDDGLRFELDASHAAFFLKRGHEEFDDLARLLREAERDRTPLIITADEQRQVIHIVLFKPGPDDGPLPEYPLPPVRLPFWDWFRRWRWWPIWPWNWHVRGCISRLRAQQVFDSMNATSCAPLTVPAPCIPFLYPDDGCWARAHEMARLMIAGGFSPRKVWIRGSLQTPTRNNPACYVWWNWHVAPTLCVRRWRLWFPFPWSTERMVIDPSLFTTPVSVAQWKSVQGDPAATLTYTDASDYLWGQTDPTYALTNSRLAFYRLRLQERAVNVGPPPYAQCP